MSLNIFFFVPFQRKERKKERLKRRSLFLLVGRFVLSHHRHRHSARSINQELFPRLFLSFLFFPPGWKKWQSGRVLKHPVERVCMCVWCSGRRRSAILRDDFESAFLFFSRRLRRRRSTLVVAQNAGETMESKKEGRAWRKRPTKTSQKREIETGHKRTYSGRQAKRGFFFLPFNIRAFNKKYNKEEIRIMSL